MGFVNKTTLRLKKTTLDAGNKIMTDPNNEYILEYGEALYINNHKNASGNDYLTFGSVENKIEYDPTTGKPLSAATEAIKTHNQFFKAQTKTRADRAIFYPDNITPRDDDRVNNISTQLINDQGINVYPVIIPTCRIKNYTFIASGSSDWETVSSNPNVFKFKTALNITGIDTTTKISISCKAENLQKMLTNNIYSIHIENNSSGAYLYALAFTNPGSISLNLQLSIEKIFIDSGDTVDTIIGDGIVASDGNNIEIGTGLPSSKAKLWINSSNNLLYYKNASETSGWSTVTSTFG